ncbi:MAG: hypothetical protein CMM01_26555 [Rhodopirellula sp.]|nr:hypothetical protein [Rhodopirellula sp.]
MRLESESSTHWFEPHPAVATPPRRKPAAKSQPMHDLKPQTVYTAVSGGSPNDSLITTIA